MKQNKAGNKNTGSRQVNTPAVPKQPSPAARQPAAPAKAPEPNGTPNTGSSFLSKISFEEKVCLGLLACIVIVVVAIKSNFLNIPFERDEGAYSYYGKLLLHGKIPYKDFYEQKFPGIFYFYALVQSIVGDTVRGMHMGFIFLNVATILVIYYAARTLFSPIAGVISAATFAMVALSPGLSGFTVQSEHGVAFFISLGILFYALYRKSDKWLHLLLMGISFGCGFLIKTNGVFLGFWGGLMLVLDFFFEKKKSFKQLLGQVVVYTAGVFVFIVLLFLVILAKGSFKEMMYWGYTFPKEYVGKITWEQGKQMFDFNLKQITNNHMFFWVHSLLAVVVCLLPSISARMKAFTVSLLVCSFMTIVPGLYFYGHYWIQLIPGLAIAAGVTYYGIVTQAERMGVKLKALGFVYLGVFGIFLVSHISSNKDYYFDPDYDTILHTVYGNNPFPEAWEIGQWINANSKPEDQVVVAGSEPEIYFYTHKICPSRHAYFSFLVWNVPEHVKWQREFAADVEKAKPRYFIFFNHAISLLVQPNTDHFIFEWMQKWVDANYSMVAMVDMLETGQSIYQQMPGRVHVDKWKEQMPNYRPQSKYVVYIFERKPEPGQPQQNGK